MIEDKLKELKKAFCKFYCKYTNNPETSADFIEEFGMEGFYKSCVCGNENWIECGDCEPKGYFYPCDHCQVDDYIKFIRDDIK